MAASAWRALHASFTGRRGRGRLKPCQSGSGRGGIFLSIHRPVTLLLVAALLAATPALARHAETAREREESNPAPGQLTCVAPATPGCEAWYPTNPAKVLEPAGGVLILDAMVWTGAVVHNMLLYDGAPQPHFSGADRETGGAMAPLVVPGQLSFRAWYGYWLDADQDGVIDLNIRSGPPTESPQTGSDFEAYRPGNEFATADEGATRLDHLVAFVTPGARPAITDTGRPAESQPDLVYALPGSNPDRMFRSFTSIVAVDGSLLEAWTIESVGQVALIPDENLNRPYRVSEHSRLDIDRYAAVAPGPVESIYKATVAPLVREFASPSLGSCPGRCNFPPAPVDAAGPAIGAAYGRYEREVDPALADDPRRASTNAGRLGEFQAAYHAWIDVLPSMTLGAASMTPLRKNYPLPGKSADGGLAVLPGTLVSFELWTGVWKDLNGDGYIGVASADPYEGGNRPQPERYDDPAGEFVPWNARNAAGGTAQFITVTPDGTWGQAGVYVFATAGVPAQGPCVIRLPTNNCVLTEYLGEQHILRGTETHRRQMTVVAGTEDGHWTAGEYLWFPEGTMPTGFTVCTDKTEIQYEAAGVLVPESVRDCDHVGRLE
ncbi:MAG TPA: hypothetical protein VM889_00680 [Candidatus Thermoplasmatota archaeon]|nr:hypothetical protein [Candidatus Thermoplasmatota archaeon]